MNPANDMKKNPARSRSVWVTLILAALILGVTVTFAYDAKDGLGEGMLAAILLSVRELIGHAYGHVRAAVEREAAT